MKLVTSDAVEAGLDGAPRRLGVVVDAAARSRSIDIARGGRKWRSVWGTSEGWMQWS